MSFEDNDLHFFLGANTPQGFVSRFDQLFDEKNGRRSFILKGGPGAGKSTLMKHFARAASALGYPIERIHCSSDVDSIDAVIAGDDTYSILDGTPPHAVEPKYPGAYETLVAAGDCWDEEKLSEQRGKIIELFSANRRLQEQCQRYLSAAGSLLGDVSRLALETVSTEKVASAAKRLSQREFGCKAKEPGREKIRFLSALTNRGVMTFDVTVSRLCDKIYVIDDEWGAASKLFMAAIRKNALEAGRNIITCYCSMFPYEKIEHVFIPELRLGFMTSNHFHKVETTPYRAIHARRFMNESVLSSRKLRIRFTQKAADELIKEAERCMKEAKAVHDELESCYTPCVNFDKLREKENTILSLIK